jgi:short-subunit dehydrogenase
MSDYRGQNILITGATTGIGWAFADELAARGANLILVARSEDKLQSVAADLAKRHGGRVEVVAADLRHAGEAQRVYETACRERLPPDLLISNAGIGSYGPFEQLPIERERDQVLLNVLAVVELARLCLPVMVARGRGGIINVASAAAFQPLPYMTVYAATKAFVLSFSEALWTQYRGTGVKVLALCPGPVDTPFFDALDPQAVTGPKIAPRYVVAVALQAWERDRSCVVPGWRSYLLAMLPRLFPRGVVSQITRRMLRPRTTAAGKLS